MKILFFLILTLLISFNLRSNENTRFVIGIQDIPIYKNMKTKQSSLVIFDKNEGRFITSEIQGDAKINEVKKYYSDILPNLGWKRKTDLKFQRDNELLLLTFTQNKKNISVVFKILPN